MTQPGTAFPIKATLVDTTKCIGCRACQVACKQWNDREGEETELQVGDAYVWAEGQGVSRSSDQKCSPARPLLLA